MRRFGRGRDYFGYDYGPGSKQWYDAYKQLRADVRAALDKFENATGLDELNSGPYNEAYAKFSLHNTDNLLELKEKLRLSRYVP